MMQICNSDWMSVFSSVSSYEPPAPPPARSANPSARSGPRRNLYFLEHFAGFAYLQFLEGIIQELGQWVFRVLDEDVVKPFARVELQRDYSCLQTHCSSVQTEQKVIKVVQFAVHRSTTPLLNPDVPLCWFRRRSGGAHSLLKYCAVAIFIAKCRVGAYLSVFSHLVSSLSQKCTEKMEERKWVWYRLA